MNLKIRQRKNFKSGTENVFQFHCEAGLLKPTKSSYWRILVNRLLTHNRPLFRSFSDLWKISLDNIITFHKIVTKV